MSDVFISYSRLDKEFVGRLRDALNAQAQEVWIDWESIPPSQAWWDEIKKGIARANNFVVVLSPHSMASPICHLEVEYARQLRKRIIPVLYRDYERDACLIQVTRRLAKKEESTIREIWGSRHPSDVFDANDGMLKHINYFMFTVNDNFDIRFHTLFEVIRADYAHKEHHTRLKLRALEWDRRDRDASFLLLDNELAESRAWLENADDKEPQPSPLQVEYIAASQKRTRQLRNIRRASVIGVGMAVVTLVFALIASFLGLQANNSANNAATREAQAITREADAVIQVAVAGETLTPVSQTLTPIPATLTAAALVREEAEDFADSVQLAIRGQDMYNSSQNNSLGLRLAYEASLIDDSPQTQRILSEMAYAPGARRRLLKHTNSARDIAISSDGRTALTVSCAETDGDVCVSDELIVWDLITGEEIRRLEGPTDIGMGVAISPDGRTALSVACKERTDYDFCISGELILWDMETGEIVNRLEGHRYYPFKITFGPDGRTALSTSCSNNLFVCDEGELILWNLETGEILRRYEGHGEGVTSVAFSPNGNLALSGSCSGAGLFCSSGEVILWDLNTGDIIHRFEEHIDWVTSVAFHPDGGRALSASLDGVIILWDTRTGEVVRRFEQHTQAVNSVAFSSDGNFFLSGSEDRTLILWDVETGEIIHQFEGHTDGITDIAMNQNRGIALSAAFDHTLMLWNMENGAIVRRFEPLTLMLSNLTSAAFTPDGRFALTASSWDYTLSLWDVANGELVRSFQGHTGTVYSIIFGPDGRTILSGSADATAILWEVDTGRILRRFEGHDTSVGSVALSPDGSMVITSSCASFNDDRDCVSSELIFLNIHTNTIIHRAEGHNFWVQHMAFSPDGQSVITASCADFSENDCIAGELLLWDINTGDVIRRLEGHAGLVRAVAFSPDGRTVISGSNDSSLILWDVDTGEVIRRLEGHGDFVFNVTFSPDGRTALSGSNDNALILWEINTGEVLRRFEGHNTVILDVVYSSDGNTARSISADSTLIEWRLDEIEQLQAWILNNRYMPELTCEQRITYDLPEERQCIDRTLPPSPTLAPTRTPHPLPTVPQITFMPLASPTASDTPTPTSTFTPTPTVDLTQITATPTSTPTVDLFASATAILRTATAQATIARGATEAAQATNTYVTTTAVP